MKYLSVSIHENETWGLEIRLLFIQSLWYGMRINLWLWEWDFITKWHMIPSHNTLTNTYVHVHVYLLMVVSIPLLPYYTHIYICICIEGSFYTIIIILHVHAYYLWYPLINHGYITSINMKSTFDTPSQYSCSWLILW